MNKLTEIIKDRIRREGPVSFRDFMEMSLYYPGQGYYTSGGDKIGREGDFYTSPYLTTLFGEMLANQLVEMWQALGTPRFTIVECGAGTGLLCRDILLALENKPDLYSNLDYFIVERSPQMREKQEKILPGKVRWFDSMGDIPPVTGCLFSNELIDNFSVHQVIMLDDLMEVFVDEAARVDKADMGDPDFVEILRPADKKLIGYFHRLEVALPRGYRTEVNLQAIDWITSVSACLEKGFVMTIDYGHPSSVLYSPGRDTGTLVCYHKHRMSRSPYELIGDQDITAHVNFSALHCWGQSAGLDCCGFTTQAFFLQGLGLVPHLKKIEDAAKNGAAGEQEKMALVNTFLMNMGTRFKVLIQRKEVRSLFLSGMRFPQRLV